MIQKQMKGEWKLEEELQNVIMEGKVRDFKNLIDRGVPINAKDQRGVTAVVAAVKEGDLEVVEFLVNYRATYATAAALSINGFETTALKFLAEWGRGEMVRILVGRNETGRDKGEYLGSALLAVSKKGDLASVIYLSDNGVSLDLKGSDGDRALVAASQEGYIEIVKYLGDEGASLDAAGVMGWRSSTGCSITGGGHIEVVKYHGDKGTSLDSVERDGDRALVAASRAGYIEVVKYLGDKGASLDAEGRDGDRALVAASGAGHIEVVKYLGDKGASLDAEGVLMFSRAILSLNLYILV
ncbi:ankyrin repeat-containing domain protein [Hysterangium stoloniferum]|nr:ankyrin repeat-containing domain protein [Hysterangium stoloniferum]